LRQDVIDILPIIHNNDSVLFVEIIKHYFLLALIVLFGLEIA
jgi:hypothetical protein